MIASMPAWRHENFRCPTARSSWAGVSCCGMPGELSLTPLSSCDEQRPDNLFDQTRVPHSPNAVRHCPNLPARLQIAGRGPSTGEYWSAFGTDWWVADEHGHVTAFDGMVAAFNPTGRVKERRSSAFVREGAGTVRGSAVLVDHRCPWNAPFDGLGSESAALPGCLHSEIPPTQRGARGAGSFR